MPDGVQALPPMPFWDRLKRDYPHGALSASEGDVGLPAGQMGNSEVGHMNIGAGRVVMQDLPRIDAAIASGALAKNAALRKNLTGHSVPPALQPRRRIHPGRKSVTTIATLRKSTLLGRTALLALRAPR